VFFDLFDGFINTFIVIGNREVNIQRTNVNVELEFTRINTDVNALIHFSIHNKLTLACIMESLTELSRPSRLFECCAWSLSQCSFLLSVSLLRSHKSIELLQNKALFAAKAWVSFYRKLEIISNLGGVIIYTRN
jgi:hypothetical protein